MDILVTGTNRPLGVFIALNLLAAGHGVIAARRTPSDFDTQLRDAGAQLDTLDLRDRDVVLAMAGRVDTAVLTSKLSIAEPAILQFASAGMARGVAFSSNNVAIVGADPVYDALRASEAQILAEAPGWAVLRPTMIYGHRDDGNLSRLLGWLARYPLVPFPGSGKALQQPIHVRDLARLAAGLAGGEWNAAGALAVGGPQVMAYRDMIALIRRVVGSRARVVHMPAALTKLAAAMAGVIGIGQAQLRRVDLDKGVVDPPDIPPALRPQIALEDGLRALAVEIGLIPPDH